MNYQVINVSGKEIEIGKHTIGAKSSMSINSIFFTEDELKENGGVHANILKVGIETKQAELEKQAESKKSKPQRGRKPKANKEG